MRNKIVRGAIKHQQCKLQSAEIISLTSESWLLSVLIRHLADNYSGF